MDKNINIEKIKQLNNEESVIISNLFGMTQSNIQTLLNYGFAFDYDNRLLKSNIEMNNIIYTIQIDYTIDKGMKYYYINCRDTQGNKTELKGSGSLSLYAEIERDINSFNVERFLYWIKNLYELNTKDSFKEFVNNEKSKDELKEKPIKPERPILQSKR